MLKLGKNLYIKGKTLSKKFSLLLYLVTFAYSENYYQIAQKYEKQKNYKKATEHYKLALEEQNLKLYKAERERDLSNFQAVTQEQMAENYQYNFTPEHKDEEFDYFGIQAYKTNYFLPLTYNFNNPGKGNKRWESEFQISIQKPLFSNYFGWNESLVMAYTQRAFWQTLKNSVPFRETNYQPEIFLSFLTNFSSLPSLIDLQFGYLHDSNGKDGDISRSWNRLYAQAHFEKGSFELTPRIWWILPLFDGDNDDIGKYYGYGDINLAYNFENGSKINALLRNNLRSHKNKGAIEASYSYPLAFGIDLFLKYFGGYGDSLIDYDRKMHKIGLGFSIVM